MYSQDVPVDSAYRRDFPTLSSEINPVLTSQAYVPPPSGGIRQRRRLKPVLRTNRQSLPCFVTINSLAPRLLRLAIKRLAHFSLDLLTAGLDRLLHGWAKRLTRLKVRALDAIQDDRLWQSF